MYNGTQTVSHIYQTCVLASMINISEFLSLLCTDRLIEDQHLRIYNELV